MNRLISCLLLMLAVTFLRAQAQTQGKVEVHCAAHKAIKTVVPNYPDALRKQGIEGQLFLLIDIDRKGNVVLADVWKSLHPELDRSAVEALKQWKFPPYTFEGEPIRTTFFVRVVFISGDQELVDEGPPPREPAESMTPELMEILNRCDEYSRKLVAAALFYVCTEKMSETSRDVVEKSGGLIRGLGHDSKTGTEIMEATFAYKTLGGKRKNEYLYDYQLIRKEGKVEEQRVLLETNGKKIQGRIPVDTANRLYSLKPIYVPAWLLGAEQRPFFSYQMTKEETVGGRLANVIEVRPRILGGGDVKSATIWVDKSTCRVLKAELRTSFMAGYESFLQECSVNHWKPTFTCVYYYEVEKGGILYPGQCVIRIEYDKMTYPKRDVKYSATIRYSRYKFFTVETEMGIREVEDSGLATVSFY